MDGEPRVLTVVEAAHELRLCTQTIYDMARDGKIAVVRIGRRVLVPRASIDKLLQVSDNVTA